jgi:hypothetical protein
MRMTLSERRSNCRRCIHFKEQEGWWCTLLTVAELQRKEYQIDPARLPQPENFVCNEGYEPP